MAFGLLARLAVAKESLIRGTLLNPQVHILELFPVIVPQRRQNAPVLERRVPQYFGIGPVKRRIIAETRFSRRLLGAASLYQQLLGQCYPLMKEIIKYCSSGSLPENLIHMVLAEKESLRKLIQGNIFLHMAVQVQQNPRNGIRGSGMKSGSGGI